MARKKHGAEQELRELKRELYDTTQALREAYTRFDLVCDNDLIDACIFEINALKAKSSYLLRCIKSRSGQTVPSGIPQAVIAPCTERAVAAEPCMAAGAIKGGEICRS